VTDAAAEERPRWIDAHPRALAFGAASTALYATAAAGAPLPAGVAVAAALLALVLWPGAMLLRFIQVEGVEIEWPGRVSYAFALGWLPVGAVALAAHFLHFDAGIGLWLLPVFGFALCAWAPPRVPAPADPRSLLPSLLLAGWVIGIAALVGSLGAPMSIESDSLDHIATVRRIAVTHETFPTDAFFADAGATGADPRKGLYHAALALVVRASHVDPARLWRMLPLFFIPFFLLAAYVFAQALTRSRMVGLVTAFLFPFLYGGGIGGSAMRETVYSTRVSEIAALLAAAALMPWIEHGHRRRLALFVLVAVSAIWIHVWIALYAALAFGAYAVGALLAEPSVRRARRFAAAALGLAVLAGPYLALRAHDAYGPQNPIHTDPQGLLYLTPHLFTVDPQALWGWNGPWLLVTLLAVPWFWSRRHTWSGAAYLATVTPAILLVVLDPFVLPLVHARLGYLTMRLIWIAPVIPAVATVVTALSEAVVRGRGWRRARGAVALAALTVLFVPRLAAGLDLVTHHAALVEEMRGEGAAPWADVLAFLRDRVPGPRVVAADPATSYTIPAYTGHQVMAFFDQHSSPNDPRGLARILDARDVLSPFTDTRRTLTILRAYGVDLVVVNERFTAPVSTDYWSMTPELLPAILAKFRARPDLFAPIYDSPGAWVFALTDSARRGTLPAPAAVARPFLEPRPGGGRVDGAFTIFDTRLPTTPCAAGDTVRFTTRWGLARPGALPPGNYTAFVRLETPYPHGPGYVVGFDKVYRKALEARTHVAWRVRTTHRPLDGVYGPDQWRYDESVVDDYAVALPRVAVPGTYDVRLRMLRLPHYENTTPNDYVSDADAYEGPVVGRITIVAPGGAR
jgi:hypothetical protein